jgi:hypothetical protein
LSWENHYRQINFKVGYLLAISNSEKVLLIINIIFDILAITGYIIFYDGKFLGILWFLFTSILFSFFLFKFFLFKSNIKIFKKFKENIIGFRQSSYRDIYLNKITKEKEYVFFVTWLGNNDKSQNDLNKAIYFHIYYEYLKYLKTYRLHKYIVLYVVKSFISTAFAFHGLVVLLTSINININNQNIIFFFALAYIIYIISMAYIPYIEREQRFFFKNHIKDFKKENFLVDDNLYRVDEQSKKSADVLGIVFGVLFSLYITLVQDIIYITDVDIKSVSVSHFNGLTDINGIGK